MATLAYNIASGEERGDKWWGESYENLLSSRPLPNQHHEGNSTGQETEYPTKAFPRKSPRKRESKNPSIKQGNLIKGRVGGRAYLWTEYYGKGEGGRRGYDDSYRILSP